MLIHRLNGAADHKTRGEVTVFGWNLILGHLRSLRFFLIPLVVCTILNSIDNLSILCGSFIIIMLPAGSKLFNIL